MKGFQFFFIILSLNFSLHNYIQKTETIIANKKYIMKEIKLNKEILLQVNLNNLEKLQKYKIMVHYIGSYAISFKIKLICDDIYDIKNIEKKENINLNDFSEYDFKTDEKGIPTQCGNHYNKKEILLSLIPYSISYQFKPEESIKFNIVVELISNKFNTDIKPLNILFNKGLFKGVIFGLIIVPMLIFVFRNKINDLIRDLVDFKLKKED